MKEGKTFHPLIYSTVSSNSSDRPGTSQVLEKSNLPSMWWGTSPLTYHMLTLECAYTKNKIGSRAEP